MGYWRRRNKTLFKFESRRGLGAVEEASVHCGMGQSCAGSFAISWTMF